MASGGVWWEFVQLVFFLRVFVGGDVVAFWFWGFFCC